jgi:hypothetical protein
VDIVSRVDCSLRRVVSRLALHREL